MDKLKKLNIYFAILTTTYKCFIYLNICQKIKQCQGRGRGRCNPNDNFWSRGSGGSEPPSKLITVREECDQIRGRGRGWPKDNSWSQGEGGGVWTPPRTWSHDLLMAPYLNTTRITSDNFVSWFIHPISNNLVYSDIQFDLYLIYQNVHILSIFLLCP